MKTIKSMYSSIRHTLYVEKSLKDHMHGK